MRVRIVLVGALLSGAALCQQQTLQPPPASRAKPSDLSISCRVDASTRTAEVTIVNHTDTRIRFGGPMQDFEAELRSPTGERLPRHEDAPTSPKQARSASIATGDLVPNAQHTPFAIVSFLIMPD